MPDMSHSQLSIWQQEYALDHDDVQQATFDVDIPVIADVQDWTGWAWIRSSATWIEVESVELAHLDVDKQCYLLLLRSKGDPSHQIAIYPVSSTSAHGTLRGGLNDHGTTSKLRLHARRVSSERSPGSSLVVAVSSKDKGGDKGGAGSGPQPWRLIQRCVEIGRQWAYQLEGRTHEPTAPEEVVSHGPLENLSFCTWTSLGETTRPTIQNLTSLCQSLHSSQIPIESFLIDAGWQSINSHPDTGNVGADTIHRKLLAFEPYDESGASLEEVVRMIKKELPCVKDVGVWMTLQGFWQAIDPTSPLVAKHGCKPYPISREGLPGIPNEPGSISYINPEDPDSSRVWYLPPPSRAYEFWSDWLSYLKTQGVSWIKVDNQASMSILDGVEGAECGRAMWEGMVRAAEVVFGPGRVLHCMSHSERMFNGDIGLGLATNGKKIVMRNTDDYGRLWLSNPHQDHIFQNLYTSLLTSHLHVIPDGDMFMSSSEAPVFHAILRALMPGPILLTDKQGQHDPALINRFVGQTRSGKQVILKTDDPVRPVQNRLFDRECREGGRGGALVGSVYLPRVKSSIIGSWNVRENHVDNRVDDWLTAQDLRDAFPDALSAEEYLIYKPGYCSDSAWAIWNLQKDKDEGQVMHITLNHLAAETVLVVPIHSAALPVGDKGDLQMVKVAVCGLVDKFAGLVGVTGMNLSSENDRTKLSCRVRCTGTFGVFIQHPSELLGPTVRVDNMPIEFDRREITGPGLEQGWYMYTFPIERLRGAHPEAQGSLKDSCGGDRDEAGGMEGGEGWHVNVEWHVQA